MEALLLFLPFLVPVIVAQFAEKQRWAQAVTYALLIVTNVALLGLAGLGSLLALAGFFAPELVAVGVWEVNWVAVTAACLLTGLLAFVPLIPGVRAGLRLPGASAGISIRGRIGLLISSEAGALMESERGERFPLRIHEPARALLLAVNEQDMEHLRYALAAASF